MEDLMVSVSGIRGVFGTGITPEFVCKIASKFGLFCRRGTIVVGRDSRTTGKIMLHSIKAGLLAVGCRVIDIGVVPTPTVLISVKDKNANGGISITASHNPAQWNAMKFAGKNGMFLSPEKIKKFISTLDSPIEFSKWNKVGSVECDKFAVENHVKKILSIPFLDIKSIREKNFKVAVDNVNGAGGKICEILLKKLNCTVVGINTQPTGIFAHNPEPLNKNLSQLKKCVVKNGADIGFATDPDVDRLAIVNEKGETIGEEHTLPLCADFVLPKVGGDYVVNLSSSSVNDDIAKKHKTQIYRTKIGEINVSNKMKEVGSHIGGEGNGGVILPAVNLSRDASCGIAIILSSMATKNKTISELDKVLPKYHFAKDRIDTSIGKLDYLMERAKKLQKDNNFLDGKSLINTVDGIKLLSKDSWVHIRKSGTEPIIRVFAESTSKVKATKLCEYTKNFLNNL